MKYIHTIIIIFFALSVYGQNSNNEIYSLVLTDLNSRWYKDTLTQFVIIKNFHPDENYIDSYDEITSLNNLLYNSPEMKRDNAFSYDTTIITLIKKNSIQKCLKNLQANFYHSPKIKRRKLKVNYTTISSEKFDKFFLDRCQGWKKFYSHYPKSTTVFALSRIEFTENYACFYLENFTDGLNGWGGVVITKKDNNDWKIINYIPIWEGWNYCEQQ